MGGSISMSALIPGNSDDGSVTATLTSKVDSGTACPLDHPEAPGGEASTRIEATGTLPSDLRLVERPPPTA